MPNYDGDIKLSVSLDPKDVRKSADELTGKISKLFEASAGKQSDAGFKKMLVSMDKTYTKATQLKDKLDELLETQEMVDTARGDKSTTAKLKEYEKVIEHLDTIRRWIGANGKTASGADWTEISKLSVPKGTDFEDYAEKIVTEYETLKERIKDYRTVSDKEYAEIVNDINTTKVALAQANNEMRMSFEANKAKISEMESGTKRYEGANEKLTATIQRYIDKAREAGATSKDFEQAMASIIARASDLESQVGGMESEEYARLDAQYGDLKARHEELIATEMEEANQLADLMIAVQNVIEEEDSLKTKMKQLAKTMLGLAFVAPFKSLASHLMGVNKHGRSANMTFGKLFKTVLRYGLGIRSLFFLFRKLRSAIAEGLGNLRQFNGGVNPINTALSELSASLTTLKNAWAAAFAPIIQYVAPILQSLISMLISAANAVGSFFAALTGQSTVIRATKVQANLAEALGDTGSAAQEAKKQLAGFDELNVLNDNGSGGGGGGSGGAGGLDFEEMDIESGFSDLAERIKQTWATDADFTWLGEMIGTKLKEGLDSIDWSPIKKSLRKIAKAVATLLNGFLEVNGLAKSIGKTIAELINSAVEFANTFLGTFHFDSLGKFITEGLYSALLNLDFGLIASALSNYLIGVFDFIRGLIAGIDWAQIPRDIWTIITTFLSNVDFVGIFFSLGELIATALKAALDFGAAILELLEEGFKKVWKYFEDKIEEAKELGGNWFDGILFGIGAALKDIWNWMNDNVFTPIVDAFKSVFEINSPSHVMEKLGGDLIEGLFKGISDLIDSVVEIFNNLKRKIHSVWENVKLKTSEIWNNIKFTVENIVTSIWNSLSSIFTSIWNTVTSVWSNIWSTISNIATNIWGTITSIFNGISSTISGIWSSIQTTTTTIFNSVKTFVSSTFGGLWSDISTTVQNIWNSVSTGFTNIKDTAIGIFDGLKTSVSNIFSGMWEGIKGIINNIIGGIETMANGVVRGINAVIGAINRLSFRIPDWVPEYGGHTFGMNLGYVNQVSIPRLAQGAVIPPNREFIAMLGDQRSGTNIEAPLETIKDAVRQVIGEDGNSSSEMVQLLRELIMVVQDKDLSISERLIGETAIKQINNEKRRTGVSPILD